MTTTAVGAAVAPSLLQGALVALPRGDALGSLRRVRSPAWAAVLPGAILVGTFGPLGVHSFALGMILLAALAMPPLVAVAVLGVVRGPRTAVAGLALVAGAMATFTDGPSAQLSASILTALGALALGAALARLIPSGWILIGFTGMCALDVALLAAGVGQAAAADLVRAAAGMPGPVFDHAQLGHIALGYPDLVLAALLGAALPGQREQRSAAALVTVLAAASLVLAPANTVWPATVPVAATLIALRAVRLPRRLQRKAPVPEPATA
jgi:hypothetical protein